MPDEFLSGSVLRVPAQLELLDGLRESFGIFLKSCRLPKQEISDWKLVLSESLTNAIIHGCREDPSRFIEITWTQRGEEIVLEVQDDGTGPDVLTSAAPTLPCDPAECGRRGKFIIHAFCDRCEEFAGPTGFRQIMRKQHPGMVGANPVDQVLDATLEELSQCYESLSAFYRLGEALLKYDSIARFIKRAIEDIEKVVRADRIFISFSTELHEVVLEELDEMRMCIPGRHLSGLQQQVLQSNQERVWKSADETSGDAFLESYASGFSTPVSAAGDTLGVLTLARKRTQAVLNASELNTVRTFAELIGIAVANESNSITRTREHQAFRELEIASDIQQSLLPAPKIPRQDNWRVFAERKGAREVAGDYLDVCLSNEGDIYLVVVDVMGKGISSAFLAAMFRTAFYIILNFHSTLLDLVLSLNRILHSQVGDATMFATVCIAKVPASLERIEVLNAGHCPGLLLSPGDERPQQIEPSGPPLGLYPEVDYQVREFPAEKGTKLVMLTDGLYEWMKGGDIFGWEPLVEFINTHMHEEPRKMWDRLQEKIAAESDVQEMADDQTLLLWEKLQ